MPPKKVTKGLVGKEVSINFKFEQQAEGPFQILGMEYPFLNVRHIQQDSAIWFHMDNITAMKEVVSAKQ